MGTMLGLMGSSRSAAAKPLPTGPKAAEIKRRNRERGFDSNTKQIIPPGMEQNQSGRNLTAVIPPCQPPPAALGPDDPRLWAGTLRSKLKHIRGTPNHLQSSGLQAWRPQRGQVKFEVLGSNPRVSSCIGGVRVEPRNVRARARSGGDGGRGVCANWACGISLRAI